MRQDGLILLGELSAPGSSTAALAGDGSWGAWGINAPQPVPLSVALTDMGAPGDPTAYLAGDGSWRRMDGTLVAGSSRNPSSLLTALASPDDSTKFVFSDGTWAVAEAQPTLDTPTFDPPAGTYAEAQLVTITSTPYAPIYYTTDGSEPTLDSALYTAPVPVEADETIKAIAIGGMAIDSAVGSAAYVIEAAPAVTWDPANASSGLVFSSGNLVATTTLDDFSAQSVRATTSHATGKFYVEALPHFTSPPENEELQFGFAVPSFDMATNVFFFGNVGVPDDSSYGWTADGVAWYTPAPFHHDGAAPTFDSDVVAGIAIDFDAGKIWFRNAAGWMGDPAAGTGASISFTPNQELFFAFTCYAGGGVAESLAVTANFGATSFAYAVPAGFTAWGV